MKKIILYSILFLSVAISEAQTKKADVLVIGSDVASFAAGIQSARSGVQTIIMSPDNLDGTFTRADLIRLRRNAKDITKTDSTNAVQYPAGMTIKSITDTIKNLEVLRNTKWNEIEKAGKGWEVKYAAGKIKAEFLIDGSKDSRAGAFANLQNGKPKLAYKTFTPFPDTNSELLKNKIYRTSIVSAKTKLIPLGAMLPVGAENIILLKNLPAGIMVDPISHGQAAGVMAAYCSFFNTTTKQLDIRITQGELLSFNTAVIPFNDIAENDSNFVALQHIALTGILKVDSVMNFRPEETVSSDDIRATMKEYYSRSQIWFFKNQKDKLSVADAISLIMTTATRGDELKAEIEKGWKTSLLLGNKFDLNRNVTRREFAVLLDTFLKPFTVRVDLNGNLLN